MNQRLNLLRLLVLSILISGILASSTLAQSPGPAAFAYGKHYSFERLSVTRSVNDEFDKGTITLVSYVYRPLQNDRREVVLFSHGSKGGMIVSPQEPEGPPRSVIQFFVLRGYTVVCPMRRGVGESSGTYREECAYQAGACTLAENRALFEVGLREALADTYAVIDGLILGRMVPKDAKILLAGQSRGGFLSLLLAGERSKNVKGVVNFVGGWLSVSDQWPAEENAERMRLQTDRLRTAASKTTVPTIWLYAAGDLFYKETTTRAFHQAFISAGGKGDYVYLTDQPEPGHGAIFRLPLWEKQVDQSLTTQALK